MPRKITKSDENKIIFGNVFFLILIFIALGIIFFLIYPQIKEIEELKANSVSLKNDLNKYEKEGISLKNLKDTITSLDGEKTESDDKLIFSVLNEIDEKFYNKNLKNTKESTYEIFINKKLEEYKNNNSNEEKLKSISKILPYYSDNLRQEDSLTEFQFINYIESIISIFNLSYKNSIGISEIKRLTDYSLNNNDSSLDKGIYQIPVELDIVGNKSQIIEFLYFIENVGKVSIDEKTKDLLVNNNFSKPGEVFSDFRNKKMDSAKNTTDYNIFNNQIADVESIFFKEYIDSTDKPIEYSSIDSKEFLKYIKNQRGKLEVKVRINFYVKGLPKYKIDEFTSNFNKRIAEVEKEVNSLISKTTTSSSDKQKLRNIKTSLDNIKNIVKQNKSSEKNIEEDFQTLTSYDKILDEYKEQIKKIK